MTVLAFIFIIISPYLTGRLTCFLISDSLTENPVYRYVAGFIVNLGIWAAISIPYSLLCPDGAFHTLRYIYVCIICVLCLIEIMLTAKDHKHHWVSLSFLRSTFNDIKASRESSVYTSVFIIILILQLFNITYYAPSAYVQDDYFYYATVNDNVYMDQLYTKESMHGTFTPDDQDLPPYQRVSYKFIISPWLAYLSYIAASINIHPLIVCHTLMPCFIILLIYLVLFIFADYFFHGSTSDICCFMMWSSIIMQAFCYTYYLFHLGIQVAVWGKILIAFIGLPILFLTIYDISKASYKNAPTRKAIGNCIALFIIGMGTAMMAASFMMVGSAGLFLLMLTCLIRLKKKEVIFYTFAAELPVFIQLALWQIVIS